MGDSIPSWNYGMERITISFTNIGIRKKLRFEIRFRLSDRIEDFMNHLKASKGIIGKLVRKDEVSDRMTLAEAGILPGEVIEMESYTPPKRSTYSIPVTLPDGREINIPVHSRSTVHDLKHKIQDEIGMHAEEQLLKWNGKQLKQDKLSVEICGYKKIPVVLERQPSEFKPVYKRENGYILQNEVL